MSKFNNINYENFGKYEEKHPIVRKLRIVNNESNENEEQNSFSYADNDSIQDNITNVHDKSDNMNNCSVSESTSMKTIDLNSTMPYGMKKQEKRFYDSYTNTSFNDINELNDIRFSGKKEQLLLDVEETKNILRNNIQKVYERDNILNTLEEKSESLLDGAHKFNKTSKFLKRKMYFNYLCHSVSIILTIIIITTLIIILVKA